MYKKFCWLLPTDRKSNTFWKLINLHHLPHQQQNSQQQAQYSLQSVILFRLLARLVIIWLKSFFQPFTLVTLVIFSELRPGNLMVIERVHELIVAWAIQRRMKHWLASPIMPAMTPTTINSWPRSITMKYYCLSFQNYSVMGLLLGTKLCN